MALKVPVAGVGSVVAEGDVLDVLWFCGEEQRPEAHEDARHQGNKQERVDLGEGTGATQGDDEQYEERACHTGCLQCAVC